jgi:hypothetical protein
MQQQFTDRSYKEVKITSTHLPKAFSAMVSTDNLTDEPLIHIALEE